MGKYKEESSMEERIKGLVIVATELSAQALCPSFCLFHKSIQLIYVSTKIEKELTAYSQYY